MLKICVVGLSGRMGHVIFECCQGMEGCKIVSGVAKNDTPLPLGSEHLRLCQRAWLPCGFRYHWL